MSRVCPCCNRERQAFHFDDDDNAHFRGGEYGNSDREAYGYTLAEVKLVPEHDLCLPCWFAQPGAAEVR